MSKKLSKNIVVRRELRALDCTNMAIVCLVFTLFKEFYFE